MEESRLPLQYKTLAQAVEVRLEVKKSIFIAHAAPTEDVAAAQAILADARSRFPDASHHVSAWRAGMATDSRVERYSDDGEPGGTAGLPVLNVLKGQSLENTCVVVTRYFGGTLLGTGGLVSAYSDAAVLAVSQAGVIQKVLCRIYKIELVYNLYTPILRLCDDAGWSLLDSEFMENVTLKIAVPREEIDLFLLRLRDLSHGDIEPQALELTYMP